jgi:hypothetical protein
VGDPGGLVLLGGLIQVFLWSWCGPCAAFRPSREPCARSTASSRAGDRSAWPAALLDEAVPRRQLLAGQLRASARVAAVPAGGDPRGLEAVAVSGEPAVPE